jgi:hypothetical protein
MTLRTGEVRESLPASYRWTSLFEVALGVFLVLGHNVFRVVPNEVFFLFALFWVSFKVRDGGWGIAGLSRPGSWRRTIVLALAGTVVLQVGSELVIQPLAQHIWHQPEQVSSLLSSGMSAKKALLSLGIIWTFAAFGEELGYRGYLLTRAADLGNRTLWLRALLQGTRGCARQYVFGARSGNGLSVIRPKPLGTHPGARIERYIRGPRRVHGLGELGREAMGVEFSNGVLSSICLTI